MTAEIERLRSIASNTRFPQSLRQAALRQLCPLEESQGIKPASVTGKE